MRGVGKKGMAAALVLPMLLLADWLVRLEDTGQKRLFQALAGALILMLYVIMVSALQRMRFGPGGTDRRDSRRNWQRQFRPKGCRLRGGLFLVRHAPCPPGEAQHAIRCRKSIQDLRASRPKPVQAARRLGPLCPRA